MEDSFVFISYAHKDSARVIPLIEAMQKKGIKLWYDNGIEAGADWTEFIAGKVLSCYKFVSFISEAYNASPNCKRELTMAVTRNKDMLSIYIETVNLSAGLEMQLGLSHNLFLNRYSSDQAFVDKLCEEPFFEGCRVETGFNTVERRECPYNGKLALGGGHFAALTEDGGVVCAGDNRCGQCNTSSWQDMDFVTAGGYITAGVRKDGGVICAGAAYGMPNLGVTKNWKNIKALWASFYGIAAIDNIGKAYAVGHGSSGQFELSSWEHVEEIALGYRHTLGLKSDGTVLSVGENDKGQCAVESWQGIVAVAAGAGHSVGLKGDGTVVAVGDSSCGQCSTESWKDVVAIAACEGQTIGLKSDGTVLQTGRNTGGKYDLSGLRDVVSVRAATRSAGEGDLYTYILAKDSSGNTFVFGDDDFGQLSFAAER